MIASKALDRLVGHVMRLFVVEKKSLINMPHGKCM